MCKQLTGTKNQTETLETIISTNATDVISPDSNTEDYHGNRLQCKSTLMATEYTGTETKTKYGETCIPWTMVEFIPDAFFPDGKAAMKNYCRNPTGRVLESVGLYVYAPYCFTTIEVVTNIRECAIPVCNMSPRLNSIYLNYPLAPMIGTDLWHIAINMRLIFNPVILVIGTVTNTLSLAVLTRPGIKQSTQAYLFSILAVFDMLSLYTGALNESLNIHITKYIVYTSDISCTVYEYVNNIISSFPGWILILVTLDRVIAVARPLHAVTLCTKRHANFCLIAMFILLCLLYIPKIIGNESDTYIVFSKNEDSFIVYDFCRSNNRISHWIETVVRIVFPFIFMLTGNIMLTVLLLKTHRSRIAMNARRAFSA